MKIRQSNFSPRGKEKIFKHNYSIEAPKLLYVQRRRVHVVLSIMKKRHLLAMDSVRVPTVYGTITLRPTLT
jgi:hypothetical protein